MAMRMAIHMGKTFVEAGEGEDGMKMGFGGGFVFFSMFHEMAVLEAMVMAWFSWMRMGSAEVERRRRRRCMDGSLLIKHLSHPRKGSRCNM